MYEGRLKVISLLQVSSHDFEPTFIIFCLNWRISCQTRPNKNKSPNLWHVSNKHLSLLYFWLRMNAQAKLIRRTIGKSANTAKSLRALKTTFRKCEDRWCISKSREEFSFFCTHFISSNLCNNHGELNSIISFVKYPLFDLKNNRSEKKFYFYSIFFFTLSFGGF